MADFFDPFMTFFRENPDYDASDARREAEALLDRQTILEKTLKGEYSIDDFLDCIEAQGIDPAQYLKNTAAELEFVVEQGIPFVSNECGILIPYLR